MSRVKEEIISELEDLPPRTYGEVLDLHPARRGRGVADGDDVAIT